MTEAVRRQLHERLHKELTETKIIQLREHLIRKADSRAKQTDPNDEVATQHDRLWRRVGDGQSSRLLEQPVARREAGVGQRRPTLMAVEALTVSLGRPGSFC